MAGRAVPRAPSGRAAELQSTSPGLLSGSSTGFSSRGWIAQADQRHTDEIQDRYTGIGVPTLVCWGEDDTWIPVAKGHEPAALVPGARFEPIAGAGHLVQEDAPAELTAALIAFLQRER
ncbi:alpha/beta fold hydrolase [Streptomyces sp. NBC_01092]|nr:alpha/beta fold hydrolase [Streptomyces sp. NBC_01092]